MLSTRMTLTRVFVIVSFDQCIVNVRDFRARRHPGLSLIIVFGDPTRPSRDHCWVFSFVCHLLHRLMQRLTLTHHMGVCRGESNRPRIRTAFAPRIEARILVLRRHHFHGHGRGVTNDPTGVSSSWGVTQAGSIWPPFRIANTWQSLPSARGNGVCVKVTLNVVSTTEPVEKHVQSGDAVICTTDIASTLQRSFGRSSF